MRPGAKRGIAAGVFAFLVFPDLFMAALIFGGIFFGLVLWFAGEFDEDF